MFLAILDSLVPASSNLFCCPVYADKCCLLALKSDFCLVDIFRKKNPRAISFTWSNKDFSQASCLDRFYFFLSPSVVLRK